MLLFKLLQNINKYWRALHIPKDYLTDILEYIFVMPYVRPSQMKEVTDLCRILLSRNFNEKVEKFIAYVESYWLRIANVLSVWGIAISTNNIVENYHMLSNKKHYFGVHPRIWNHLCKSK